MNWFFLILILKLFTNIWAAPIDLLEAKDDLQEVSSDFLNKSLNITDKANDLLKSAGEIINSTASQLNENLNENVENFSENLQNFASEVEKVVESNIDKETTETMSEVVPTTEVNVDQVMPIVTSDAIVSPDETKLEEISLTTQNPVESSTEYVEKLLVNSENSSSDNVIPVHAESRSNNDNILSQPEVTEDVQTDLNSSTEGKTENKSEQNFDTTPSNAIETEQISPNSEVSLEQTTQESKPETTTSNIPAIVENLNENVEQIYNLSEKLTENVVEKAVEENGNNQDSTTVRLEETLSPVTSEETMTAIPLENEKSSTMEETTNHYPEETSSETPALKETVDSFINQVADIGSNIGKAAEELRYDASMIHEATENLINPEAPVVMAENMTVIQEPAVEEHQDNSEQAPSFKEAVDSFIEEVVEIGSKLGLIPEEKPIEEELPTTTEPLSEIINIETTPAYDVKESDESYNSSSNFEQSLDVLKGKLDEIAGNLEDNKTDSPVMNEDNKTEEIVMTTPSTMENFAENENNKSEIIENTESSNFGRSVETLIEAASEIGSNFGNAVSNFFTPNENKPETSTDSANESLMETTTPAEQSNSVIPVTEVPVEITSDDTTKSPDHENIEISTTIPTQNESFSHYTEETTKILDDNPNTMERIPQESESFNSQVLQENSDEGKPKEEEQSAKYEEYIPVAVVTIPETEPESTQPADQSEMEQQSMNEMQTEQDPQVLQGQIATSETEKPEIKETANKEEHSITTEENESEKAGDNLNEESVTKTEEITTLLPILQETTTTNSAPALDETTHALNKFENTLKTLIEQEKLKHEERLATSLETNQQETTTLAPSIKSPTIHQLETDTTTTTQSLEDTTMLPKKFEEELQMAVKALEETTHHHFEEFQNNLKEAFKKFTVWGAEHERPEATTTTMFKSAELNEETTETATTQESMAEQPTTMMSEVEVVESPKTEEPYHSGVINQNFIDKFADNYEESPVATATEMQMEKEQSSQLSGLQELMIKLEQTTETPNDLTTILPVDEELKSEKQVEVNTNESFVDVTTMYNDVKEDLGPIAENIVTENTGESVETTTEYIAETTPIPLLAKVTLQKDLNSVSLLLNNDQNTVAPFEESTVQNPDSEQMKEAQTEEIITLPTSELSQKEEMVTFIEHTDTTTVKQQEQEQEGEEATTMLTTQTQEPLTQASFMEEQQQQLESTTEHDAQTQTAAASGQTATTTTTTTVEDGSDDDDTSQQETTETDIYSSTVVEEDEMATTTVEPTATPVEPEARSLSLPPPKLEYLQNEDGVEVFYGYSIVKHN